MILDTAHQTDYLCCTHQLRDCRPFATKKKKKKNESAPVAVDESRDLPRVSAESTGPARLPEKRAKSVLGGIPSSDSS